MRPGAVGVFLHAILGLAPQNSVEHVPPSILVAARWFGWAVRVACACRCAWVARATFPFGSWPFAGRRTGPPRQSHKSMTSALLKAKVRVC